MFCPSCGRQNLDSAKFCTSCGKPLPIIVSVPPTFATPSSKKMPTGVKVLLVFVAVVVLVPVLIGFAIGFAEGFSSGLETTDQKITRLMREAAGLQPERKSFLGEDSVDTKVRELFRSMIRLNKEYQAAMDKLDIGETHKLTNPESFADPASAAEGIRQLHAAYDLDSQQEQKLRQMMQNFRNEFEDSSPFEGQILKGLDESMIKTQSMRQPLASTEKAWIDAMDDVHNYAELHHSDFKLRQGHLQIADDSERQEFNSKIDALNARRREFLQARDEFQRTQTQTWQKMGISRQDAGLK